MVRPVRVRRRPSRRRVIRLASLALVALLAIAGVITADDIRAHASIRVLQSQVADATPTGEVTALKRAAAGETVRAADLAAAIAFVQGESDGSDFRLITLLRLLDGYGGRLDPSAEAAVRHLLAGVRWWMDEPGINPIVYWSENHQVLWAAAEYLAGRRYPADRMRDGRTGSEHATSARDRLLFWLDQRWRYGFSEWNSHYDGQDLAALSTLADFADDQELASKATANIDLLLLEMAAHTFHGEFIATSGRLYAANRTTGDEGIRRIVRHAFLGTDEVAASTGIDINFLLSGYRTPPVLAAIARDTTPTVTTWSTGRDLGDLAADPALRAGDRRVMALWGMEAFTNPEAIDTSLDYIREHGLLANPFLAPFRQLDYRVLRAVGALPLVSRTLDLPTNGTALERADIYGYRTPAFAMSTTQAYRSGGFGNQEAVFQLTLDPGVTVFLSHPAVRDGDPPPNGNSPGYWTGDGHLPVSCQDRGVNVTLFDLPDGPGYGRSELLQYTHLHVPFAELDRVVLQDHRLFAQRGSALIGVIAGTSLRRGADDELIQDGRRTWWIVEASTTDDETFEAFTERVSRASASLDGPAVTYSSGGRSVTAAMRAGCSVDGRPIEVPYGHVPSPYATVAGDELRVVFAGHSLVVDPVAGTRMVD